MANPAVAPAASDIEASVLGVLLSAESARHGAEQLLAVLRPIADQAPVALALRDRDGITLHVLAEDGAPRQWPGQLAPQFALNGGAGVDPASGAFLLPLRADGRVVGALLFGDATSGSDILRNTELAGILDAAAAVMQALASRLELDVRRQALAARSVESVLEGMAHQIANPLTGASAIAQLLVDDLNDDAHRAAVRQLMQELTRAFTVVGDLLAFQRDAQAQDGVLDLNAVVEQLLRFRGYAIREMGIAIDLDLSPGFVPVRANLGRLEHAILVALRFAELQSHGTVNRSIGVRVSECGPKEVAVAITDSGPGNAPDLAPQYLDAPFHRDHAARVSNDAPDLGLVASIARSCGGRLEHQSSKQDGTTLTLVLPRAAMPARASNPTIDAGRIA